MYINMWACQVKVERRRQSRRGWDRNEERRDQKVRIKTEERKTLRGESKKLKVKKREKLCLRCCCFSECVNKGGTLTLTRAHTGSQSQTDRDNSLTDLLLALSARSEYVFTCAWCSSEKEKTWDVGEVGGERQRGVMCHENNTLYLKGLIRNQLTGRGKRPWL